MIIGRKYKILEMIGSGCFGAIMKGENVRTNEKVAIKIEKTSSPAKILKNEARIYVLLNKEDSIGGFPNIKWFGKDADFFYMVMDLLGPSLSSFKQQYIHQSVSDLSLSLDIVCTIGVQIIDRLKRVHETGLIHRDIKPDNLLFGLGRNGQLIYLIDFGFCKSYLTKNNTHVPCAAQTNIVGTPNFVSVNVHNRLTASRRDDLESVAYVLIYLFLPLNEWKLIFNDSLKEEDILTAKMSLCEHALIPSQIAKFLNCCRQLSYNETPNYEYMMSILSHTC